MSKIIKKPLIIPKNVELNIQDEGNSYLISAKGPKGKLEKRFFYYVDIKVEGEEVKFSLKSTDSKKKAFLGTAYRLVKNMVDGVVIGFTKTLEVVGVGYKVAVTGKNLKLSVGYSHDVNFAIPEGIEIKAEGNRLIIGGMDKELVGLTAAQIREVRKPEPYKGKGIRYVGENVNPAGKTGKKAIAGK